MKSVLEKIPENFSSFISTGVDRFVIDNERYFEECNKLIKEKLHPKGVFISYGSGFYPGTSIAIVTKENVSFYD
jgi:hypothetical protein